MIGWLRFWITAGLLAAGLCVMCVGVYGVFRFRYAVNRMHSAAVNDTLGAGLCLLGLAVSAPDLFTAAKRLLVAAFLWLCSPVSSHLLCRLEIETNERREEYMAVEDGIFAGDGTPLSFVEEETEGKEEAMRP